MKQVKNKGVSLRGIERNNNDINSVDGACDELINLRMKDGALRPLGEKHRDPKDLLALSGYGNFTNIFKHSVLPDGIYVALNSDSSGQSIVLADAFYGISPDTFLAEASDETSELVITASMEGAFTITTDSPSWITLSKASGTGNDTVTATLGASDTTDRTGTITFDDGTHQFTCTVTQEGIGIAADEISIITDYTAKFHEVIPLDIYPEGSAFTAVVTGTPNHLMVTENSLNGSLIWSISQNRTEGNLVFTIRVTLDSYPDYYIDITITQISEFAPEP